MIFFQGLQTAFTGSQGEVVQGLSCCCAHPIARPFLLPRALASEIGARTSQGAWEWDEEEGLRTGGWKTGTWLMCRSCASAHRQGSHCESLRGVTQPWCVLGFAVAPNIFSLVPCLYKPFCSQGRAWARGWVLDVAVGLPVVGRWLGLALRRNTRCCKDL